MASHHLPRWRREWQEKWPYFSVPIDGWDWFSTCGLGVNAIFSIFLLNQISDKYLCFGGKVRRFHAMNTKRGFPKLISKTSFRDPSNGYLINDNCVFGAEVFVIKSQRVIDRVSVRNMNVYKLDLVIPHFSKLEGVWTSEELTAGDYRWKILLYRNGNGSGEGKSVSIYAELVDYASFASHEKVKEEILIRMKNKDP